MEAALVTVLNPAESTSHHVLHRGLRLHHMEWGPGGDTEPLVLLHGIRLHARCWDHFAQAMGERRRVLALDARGHGESDWAPGEYHLHDFYEDLVAVLNGRGIDGATLIGHSLGGRVALLFAHLHPERVRRLVLVDIAPTLPLSAARHDFSRMTETPHPREFDSEDEAVEYLASILRRAPRHMIEHSVRHGMRPNGNGRYTWKYDPSLGGPPLPRPDRREWDLWEAAATLSCPTLLVYGAHSQVVTEELAGRMAREVPDFRAARIDDAGHALFTERPDAFARHLRDFLEDGPA
jgi:pimeloyl-ACP methyl ester carboxylesterase